VAWWIWVLIWIALFLLAALVLFLLARSVWRKLRLLFSDLGTASDRLAAVSAELERLQQQDPPGAEPAAVFQRPSVLRRQRFAGRTKQERRARRKQK
jgi:hypothetical protein